MREIKYRGIRKDNGEWAYGYYYEWHGKLSKNKESAIHVIVHDDIGLKIRDEQPHVIPETVGQFTGLKDKNGVEIYEGDILRCCYKDDKKIIEVKYKEHHNKHAIGTVIGFDIWFCSHEVEVIGNIHKNPEMLKGGK